MITEKLFLTMQTMKTAASMTMQTMMTTELRSYGAEHCEAIARGTNDSNLPILQADSACRSTIGCFHRCPKLCQGPSPA